MEALAGFALACNVLDTIDRAFKYAKRIKEIHSSPAGLSDECESLEIITQSFKQVSREITDLHAQMTQSGTNPALAKLALEGSSICVQIEEILVKCKPKTPNSASSAISASVRLFFNDSELKSYQARLHDLLRSVNTLVISETRNNILVTQAQLKVSSEALSSQLATAKMERSTILHTLTSVIEQLDSISNNSTQILNIQQLVRDSIGQAAQNIRSCSILRQLRFPSMNERFRSVADSASDTFEWIFSDSYVSFSSWLRSGTGIYHILGKPGSGKSTLMKFICEHPKTDKLLQGWGEGKVVVSAKFFFWKAGVADDKSMSGLIRGLLCAVILKAPTIAKVLFPRFWKSSLDEIRFNELPPLSDREILAAFDNMTQNVTIHQGFKMCFFIDGLDEFETSHSTTHYALINKISTWAQGSNGNIKLCVSSREEPVFETAFGPCERIHLQTLTRGDIEELVRQRLCNNPIFNSLAEQDKQACTTIRLRIVDEAEGVFLWVVLVLTQMEESLANGDSLAVLKNILEIAPNELTDFFGKIINSIPERYRESAWNMIAIILWSRGHLLPHAPGTEPSTAQIGFVDEDIFHRPMGLLGCSFLLEACDTGKMSNPCPQALQYVENREWWNRTRNVPSQVNSRCKGLIACNKDKLAFIHRSVADFCLKALNKPSPPYQLNLFTILERVSWMAFNRIRVEDSTSASRSDECQNLIKFLRAVDWRLAPTQMIRTFQILQAIDDHMLWRNEQSASVWEKKYATKRQMSLHGSFLLEAAIGGFYEYIAWDLHSNARHKTSPNYKIDIFTSFMCLPLVDISIHSASSWDSDHFCAVVYAFLDNGLLPNTPLRYGFISIWHLWLLYNVFSCKTPIRTRLGEQNFFTLPNVGRTIEPLLDPWLKNGADLGLELSISPQNTADSDAVQPSVTIRLCSAAGTVGTLSFPKENFYGEEAEELEKLQRLFARSNGCISLETYIRFKFRKHENYYPKIKQVLKRYAQPVKQDGISKSNHQKREDGRRMASVVTLVPATPVVVKEGSNNELKRWSAGRDRLLSFGCSISDSGKRLDSVL
ncbi:hypothetical protein QBC38DRAFT_395791 [Podospora fimiseda]|uniref:NACHT domain-containing protein n=1 Tax=Podospora fimiseda TaxID=252190 RepID=A0AAN7BKW1_9PEZI|nr:hypothetical protein QBC38DRAFT_395791 [Podospora fimiseda]